ncbi:glycoside hydrolase family 13 protein [Streptomyces sp.]|uniref:glycoside hydrolase family 13 protein n=1 Tax=Streptomyces sp. TaxID=1931 RepID=UPI002F40797C
MPDQKNTDLRSAAWWRSAVIYQVYIRSFADGNGDGVGDLAGLRARLPYLADLGADAIWINPWYPSPMADGGYDVADYRDIEPAFGTLDDAQALIGEAHAQGLKVVIDLVPNHTSSQHPWFVAARNAAPGSPERARYIFRDGRGPDGAEPPNGWQSVFGGPAWTQVPDGQWYLHLFDTAQPDLNWTNPEVGDEFADVLRFWLDRGVDGFRIDVAHGLAKDPAMPDLLTSLDPALPVHVAQAGHPFWDQDEVHDVYRRWRHIIDSYPGERTTVAEAWVYDPERLALYLRPDELHTAFNFLFLMAPWDTAALRAAVDDTLDALRTVGAPATWVLSNHDVVRHVTRYGGGPTGLRRARAATLLMLALPGGAYLYQGEELGLEEVLDIPDELLQDPNFLRTGGRDRGRDGCRVPLPWSGTEPPLGFSPDQAQTAPWLPQPPSWKGSTAEAQAKDPGSPLELYRTALRLRREHPALGDGTLRWLTSPEGTLVFAREPEFVCAVNSSGDPLPLPAGSRVLLASGPLDEGRLPQDTAVWYTAG